MEVLLSGLAMALTPLPAGINEFRRSAAVRTDVMSEIRRSAAAAVGCASADGVLKMEIEFPPLLGQKTAFDDFSNIEELDANRDVAMAMSLLPGLCQQPAEALWLCFADAKEAELAKEAWPGQAYQSATVTTIADAVRAGGGAPQQPMGSAAAAAGEGIARALGFLSAPPSLPVEAEAGAAPAASLQLVVQPGNGGPMEDWMNLELLAQPSVPMVVLNGALDKVRSGYYPAIFYPELAKCAERFFVDFEGVYYLRPLSGAGWLFRVYPEPWQLARQLPDSIEVIEIFESRPSLADAAGLLRGRR